MPHPAIPLDGGIEGRLMQRSAVPASRVPQAPFLAAASSDKVLDAHGVPLPRPGDPGRPPVPLTQAFARPLASPAGSRDLAGSAKAMVPAPLDATTMSAATTVSVASAGPNIDPNIQRQLPSTESDVHEVIALLKDQLENQDPSRPGFSDLCAHIKEELLRRKECEQNEALARENSEHEAPGAHSTRAGATNEANMQRQTPSAERSLQELNALLKNATAVDMFESQEPEPSRPSLEDLCAQMREEILRVQQDRYNIEAEAKRLEEQLQRENQEHEARVAAFEKDLAETVKMLNRGLEDSAATSMHLMQGKLVETEKVLKTLFQQMNVSMVPSVPEATAQANGSDKDQAISPEVLAQLLEEHNALLKEHKDLVEQKDMVSQRQPQAAATVRAPAQAADTGPVQFVWTAPGAAAAAISQLSPAPQHRATQQSAFAKTSGAASPKSPGRSPSPLVFAEAPARAPGSASPHSPRSQEGFRAVSMMAASVSSAPAMQRTSGAASPKSSPKASPKASPLGSSQGSPATSPMRLQGSRSSSLILPANATSPRNSPSNGSPLHQTGSLSRTNLAAVFVDMQTGHEMPVKSSVYAL